MHKLTFKQFLFYNRYQLSLVALNEITKNDSLYLHLSIKVSSATSFFCMFSFAVSKIISICSLNSHSARPSIKRSNKIIFFSLSKSVFNSSNSLKSTVGVSLKSSSSLRVNLCIVEQTSS